jgi:hypothetical protein
LQTDTFRLFLYQQTDNGIFPFARWEIGSKQIKENHLGFHFRCETAATYIYICWGPAASLQDTVSLVQWIYRLLPTQGGSGQRPGDASTPTIEPGSPVSDVSQPWWPRCDP